MWFWQKRFQNCNCRFFTGYLLYLLSVKEERKTTTTTLFPSATFLNGKVSCSYTRIWTVANKKRITGWKVVCVWLDSILQPNSFTYYIIIHLNKRTIFISSTQIELEFIDYGMICDQSQVVSTTVFVNIPLQKNITEVVMIVTNM